MRYDESMQYWLMKSEPDVFSLDDLRKAKTTLWEGVRNYQARNFMVQAMKPGDFVLFYHSSAEPTGIAGLAKVASEAIPDPTQFDKKSDYFDPKSTNGEPRWACVKVSYVEHFTSFVSLESLRAEPLLQDMLVLKKGQRLSIQPVQLKEFEKIVQMGGGLSSKPKQPKK